MQDIGVMIAIIGYAGIYTAYQQGFGPGGSFLYWFTGNPKLGAPATSQPDTSAQPSRYALAAKRNAAGGTPDVPQSGRPRGFHGKG